MTLTVTFKLGTDLDKAQVLVQNRVIAGLPRLPEEVRAARRHDDQELARPHDGRAPDLAERPLRHDLPAQLRLLNVKDQLARIPGVGEVQLFGAGDYAMRVWLDPEKVAARNLTAGDVVRAIREQNVQVAAGIIGALADRAGRRPAAADQRAGPPADEEEFGDIIVKTGARRRGHAPAATWRASSSAPRLRAALAARQQARRRASRSSSPGSNALADLRRRPRDDGGAQEELPGRRRLPHRLRPDAVRARVDRGGGPHAARSDRCWSCSSSSSSCRPGARRSFRCWPCRCRSSAPSR